MVSVPAVVHGSCLGHCMSRPGGWGIRRTTLAGSVGGTQRSGWTRCALCAACGKEKRKSQFAQLAKIAYLGERYFHSPRNPGCGGRLRSPPLSTWSVASSVRILFRGVDALLFSHDFVSNVSREDDLATRAVVIFCVFHFLRARGSRAGAHSPPYVPRLFRRVLRR